MHSLQPWQKAYLAFSLHLRKPFATHAQTLDISPDIRTELDHFASLSKRERALWLAQQSTHVERELKHMVEHVLGDRPKLSEKDDDT